MINKNKKLTTLLPILLLVITLIYTSRAYIRTTDWKDNFTLYYSAIKTTSDPLNKAFRYKGLTPQGKVHVRFPEHFVESKYLNLALLNIELAISKLKKEEEKYQNITPKIIKSYGLDPSSLLVKAGYYLAQTNFILYRDYKQALSLITPYTKDLSKFDSAGLSFYAGILFFNNMFEKSEETLRTALDLIPYSTRIIFSLCDLIYQKTANLNEIEKLALKAFTYFPYDAYTLNALIKIYKEKNDFEKCAYFSYIYGIRHHSISDLENAKNIYLFLNKKELVEKSKKRIEELSRYFNAK